jgi:hypothetical protein
VPHWSRSIGTGGRDPSEWVVAIVGMRNMAAWRRAIALSLEEQDIATLRSVAQSRTEPASRVERARILLAYWDNPSQLQNFSGALNYRL